ncbi:medium-chain acyl-CoA ligase ACSF2, mitochondrial isoform X1 [Pararge aegeria]|uniref:Medium-chain acyl-CoA ligase ACSF2, mitochondrial n=4 Tax=Pararge aegeria TaxID=116150 RepID=A0A8S4R2B2_9NEOP|nr:medium-chain acyl-CoA ligase ACSF2, mitochondrial isoform X1 [Pararge aegeria]CAH2229983.1 jg17503 [Pararge aegeria aegeria]
MLSKNMFNKTGLLSKALRKSCGMRLARQMRTENGSYFHNPGTEPLTVATLGDVIAETAHKYPGRVAVRSVHEDLTITYEELLNQADSLGCALRAQGFQKGDRLGLWTHNCIGWVVGCVGAARAGLISVLVNPVYEKAELRFCINKTKLKGLMIGDTLNNRDYYGMLSTLIPELRTSKEGFLKSKDFPNLTSVINGGKEKFSGVCSIGTLISNHKNNADITKYGSEITPEDGSLILLTSGTTGEPKAGLDSHIGVVNNVYFSGIRNSFNEGHPVVCIQVPLFHALGAIVTLLSSLRHGATVVLASPTYNIAANVDALCAEKCSIITGTPTMYLDMLQYVKRKGELPINLRVALAAGAPCSPQLIRQINAQLKVESVKALYGLSETTACVFQSLPEDSVEVVAETVGYTTDHCEVKVIDDKGNIVPFGTAGELMVRGYNTMIGYWDDPVKTKQTLRDDGWLHTGDKFTLSEAGYGKIVGRLKDIIIRGGENIAPKEIEDLINTHPDVIDSQVIGVSDERLGEELCAVVRLHEGTAFTIQELTNHCKGKLARYKIPRMLKIMDDFPKTVSGKIQKFKIKELVESGKV